MAAEVLEVDIDEKDEFMEHDDGMLFILIYSFLEDFKISEGIS